MINIQTSFHRSNDSADDAGMVVGLLDRFPELAALAVHPAEGAIVLTFAVQGRLEQRYERGLVDLITEHVVALLSVNRDTVGILKIGFEHDKRMSFVRVRRDVRSFSRAELVMLTALLSTRFGERLVRSPQEDPPSDEDRMDLDELVDFAIEALRTPASPRSMVGFREDRGVLVYYLKTGKGAKARARR
ncbi:MAG TPA: hypothetical protein VGZ00_07680 [Candidatus Baltobacteraceae bacterium]|jgi:hypothetical protein|nr:hypothetical protein [Candidatus Baltobacteraceae bacterium]